MNNIKYVDYGIANCFIDEDKRWIEMNKNLKKYPKLHNKILKHELKHYYSKNKYMDIKTELKDFFNFKHTFELLKFNIKHPKSLTQLFPFVITKKGFIPDWFSILNYSVCISILGVAILIALM